MSPATANLAVVIDYVTKIELALGPKDYFSFLFGVNEAYSSEAFAISIDVLRLCYIIQFSIQLYRLYFICIRATVMCVVKANFSASQVAKLTVSRGWMYNISYYRYPQ